ASRGFGLVLIVAPGSTQDSVDVVGLHWWRMTSGSVPDTGHPAALAVLLFVVVATIALVGMRGGGKRPETPVPADNTETTPHRAWGTALSIPIPAFWLLPVVVLLAPPPHDPAAGIGLSGSRAPPALTHAAAGLPFATLVLRTAFLAAPIRPLEQGPALDAMWRRGRYRPALIAVVVLEFILVWNDFIVGFLIS